MWCDLFKQYVDNIISEQNRTEQGTSRQRSGIGAIRKKIPTAKTEMGKKQTNNQVLIP